MALINFSNVFRSYGSQIVLDGASFSINRGDRVGLIGRNGSGKSTILRMITGVERPERGSVIVQSKLRIGQMEQEPNLDGSQTVAEAVLQGCPDLVRMEKEMRRLEGALGDPDADHDAMLALYGDLQHEFDRLGGHEFHGKAAAVLCGLGLPVEMHDRSVGVLSGGQKTRLALAQLLLSDSEMLLLDEPTNHLDLEATEWLQAYLQRSSATILLVSHDRYLLDAVCDHIVEIEYLRTTAYEGNYGAFLLQKAERMERERELYERQQQQVQKLEAYIRRYKAGNRATQAKSRENALARIEPMEKPREGRAAKITVGQAARSGRDVVRATDLGIAFDGAPLFGHLNLSIERQDRVGLVGPNGAGKTTLIRMIMGQQEPTEGSLTVGSNVQIGYFSQDFRTLSSSRTVIEEIVADSELDIPAARSMLGRFLFSDDEVFKNVADLSGGERNRVALCKLLLTRPNFLLLDEPTNHLDIATREGLITALEDFNGTLLVASHDRYLLDRVTGRIVEVADGQAKLYGGNYSEYRRKKDGTGGSLAGSPPTANGGPQQGNRPAPKTQPRKLEAARSAAAPAPKPQPNKPASIPRLEKQIGELETRMTHLNGRMNDPDLYKSPDMQAVVEEYDRVRVRLEHLYEEWGALAG
ncbi:MAG: ABC-F family ATP-binding cassette domain-containing protein [Armatimonadota bacterium]|nr:ABC-F family ATP-binding cassette domain-containing protein [Armatimonadota bacterium]